MKSKALARATFRPFAAESRGSVILSWHCDRLTSGSADDIKLPNSAPDGGDVALPAATAQCSGVNGLAHLLCAVLVVSCPRRRGAKTRGVVRARAGGAECATHSCLVLFLWRRLTEPLLMGQHVYVPVIEVII